LTSARVALVSRDLLFGSRIADAAARAGVSLVRVDDPAHLPPASLVSLLLVDWAGRTPDWGTALADWRVTAAQSARPRVVLYGPHTDLVAHADARASGLGPMWARSKLLAELPALMTRRGPNAPGDGSPTPRIVLR
jgi:hypothetical protein